MGVMVMKLSKSIRKLINLESTIILAVASLAPLTNLAIIPSTVQAATTSQTGGQTLTSGSSHNTGNTASYGLSSVPKSGTGSSQTGFDGTAWSLISQGNASPSWGSSGDGTQPIFYPGASTSSQGASWGLISSAVNMANPITVSGSYTSRGTNQFLGVIFLTGNVGSNAYTTEGYGIAGAPKSAIAGANMWSKDSQTLVGTTDSSGNLTIAGSSSGYNTDGSNNGAGGSGDTSTSYTISWSPTSVLADGTVSGTLTSTTGGKSYSKTVTMQASMIFGFVGVGDKLANAGNGSRTYISNLSYTQAQANVSVNYYKTTSGSTAATNTKVPGLSSSTITSNVTDKINILSPGTTQANSPAPAGGQYYFSAPTAPNGYTYSSVSSPNPLTVGNSLFASPSGNSMAVYYSANKQTATFAYNYSSTTNVPAVPTTQTYNGYTDDVIDSSLTTTLGSKIPVGYYISSIKNNGTGTSYNGTSTAATLAAAGLSASSTYDATAANNSWSLTLSPQAQTETFTYGWSVTTPGAPNGGPAGKLQGTLPTNKSYSGVTDSALTNPGVTDIPAGYYIKVTTPGNAAVFGDESTAAATTMSNAINSVKGPAGIAGTFNGSANNFNVALFPKTVTGNYNYQWDSKAPNAGKSGTLPSNTMTSGLVGAYFDASKLPSNGGALPGYTQSVVAPDGYTYTVSGTTVTWKNSSGTVIGTASVSSGTTALQYAASVNAYTPTGGTFTTTYIANTDSKATFSAQYTSDTPGAGTTPGKTPPALSNPVASSVGTTGSSIPLPSFTAPAGYSIKSVVAPDGTTKSDISSALNAFPYYYSSGLSSNFVYNISANTQTGTVAFRYVSGTPGTDASGKPSSSPTTPGKASSLPNDQSLTGSTGAPLTVSAFATPTGYAVDHVVGPDGVSYNTMSDAQKANPYYTANSNNFTVYFKALTSTPTLSFSLDISSGVTVPSTPAAIQFKNTDGSVWTGQTGAVIPASVITATQNALVQTLSDPVYKNWAINQYTDPNNTVYMTNDGASLSTAVSGVGGIVLPSANSYGVKLSYAGTISLSSAPNTIDFGSHVIVGTNKTYSGTLDNSAVVTDDRAKFSPWTLTVSQKTPIQEVSTLGVPLYGGISFDGYLKFKGNTVSSSPIIVGMGSKSGITTVLDSTSKDFNLTVPVSYQKPNTKFEGEVDWNLNLTPQ